MCINDIIPRDDDEWSARAKKVFKYYLRDDVPIALNVLDFGRGLVLHQTYFFYELTAQFTGLL